MHCVTVMTAQLSTCFYFRTIQRIAVNAFRLKIKGRNQFCWVTIFWSLQVLRRHESQGFSLCFVFLFCFCSTFLFSRPCSFSSSITFIYLLSFFLPPFSLPHFFSLYIYIFLKFLISLISPFLPPYFSRSFLYFPHYPYYSFSPSSLLSFSHLFSSRLSSDLCPVHNSFTFKVWKFIFDIWKLALKIGGIWFRFVYI